jgi:hypothetical protein
MLKTINYDHIKNIFDLNGRMGITDYIDFLKQDEVPKNIMKGVDCYGRKFITIKLGGYDLDDNRFFRSGQVFFQRYSGYPDIVGADFEGIFIWTTGGTNEEQYKLINDLIMGKVIKLKDEHHVNSSIKDGIVASMDYWEDKSARIIQKNWIICRYNPKYKICKKILNLQFNDYENGKNLS